MVTLDNLREKYIQYLNDKVINGDIKEQRVICGYSFSNFSIDLLVLDGEITGFKFKGENEGFGGYGSICSQYDSLFKTLYVVVTPRHKALVRFDIPKYWGIICLNDSGFEIIREAEENPKYIPSSGLYFLEPGDLNSVAEDYGIFKYLSDKEKVEEAERLNKGEDVEKLLYNYLTEDTEPFLKRCIKIVDLKRTKVIKSEEVVEKQEFSFVNPDGDDSNLNFLTLYYNKREDFLKEKRIQSEANDNHINIEITKDDIEVQLGAPWVDEEVVKAFIIYLLNLNGKIRRSFNVIKESFSGSWKIDYKKSDFSRNVLSNVKYGVTDYNALDIIESTLNLREIKINNINKQIDEKETIAALDKQKLINDKFKEWVFLDEERTNKIVVKYNSMFGKFVPKLYDGSDLVLPNSSDEVRLFSYQKDAIKKIIENDNSLLAFDVGTGKTYIMIAAAMELIRMGKTSKPMFVVPNNIVGQWEQMFLRLYPSAKLLVIEPKSFKSDVRNDVLYKIKNNIFDGIIIAYSCFEQIPVSEDFLSDLFSEINAEYEEEIDRIDTSRDYSRENKDWLIQQVEKEISKNQTKFENGISYIEENDLLPFDELGITALFVDEAHNYKNLPIDSKMKSLRGINLTGSRKCQELLYKVRCVQRNNGQIIFSTGTPLSNSIADAYVMQVYLQHKELKDLSLYKFDNWVKTFARPEQVCEIDVHTSGFRFVRRFASFHNLPELSKMFSVVADFYASSAGKDLPEFEDYTDIVLKKSKNLEVYMQNLCLRTENIRAGKVPRTEDNMLKVSTDGRKAALDLTLVGEKQEYDEFSKIYQCVNKVVEIYKEYDRCSQLIFCDYSTPKGEDFSVYQELKDRLIKSGIDKDEIQFIHSFNTESQRLALYDKVNSGEVRVLIGSTFKLGIGANVQTKLKAIHHIDVPWRPADMVQREGRILRKGNQNKEIYIYRYIIEGSFDAYSWQILETKQTFISQFLTGSAYQRSASDLEDNVLTYAEVKALALSNPLLKDLTETQNNLRNVKVLYMKELENKEMLRDKVFDYKSELKKREVDLEKTRENAEYIASLNIDSRKEEVKNACHLITLERLGIRESVIGELFDFVISSPIYLDEKKPSYYLSRNNMKYTLSFYEDVDSIYKSLWLFFKKYGDRIVRIEGEIEGIKLDIKNTTIEIEAPFVYKDELDKLQRECDNLIERIRNDQGEKG